jgi:hypothetical protein
MAGIGSYIPLIGGDNIVSVKDSGAIDMAVGTLSGVAPSGRAGSLKTSLLVALDEAATGEVPLTTAALLFSITVACPQGFVPATGAFDYTEVLPEVAADCVCGSFAVPAGVWPASFATLITAEAAFPANLVSIVGRLTGMAVPTTAHPYGTLTYAFTGAATVAAVSAPLLSVSINFGASATN